MFIVVMLTLLGWWTWRWRVSIIKTETNKLLGVDCDGLMASSQVEIASSSPFACVLRDHNRRDRCNARAAFQKNLKELVRDHLHTRISISSPGGVEDENINSQPNNRGDGWGLNKPPSPRGLRFTTNNNNDGEESWSSEMSPRESRILDRWAARQAQEMVSTIELEADAVPKNAALSPRESWVRGSEDIPNIGASSLVQMWEARLNRSNSLNALNNTCSSSAVCSSSRTNSGLSFSENATSEQQQEAAASYSSSSSSSSSSRGGAPPPPPLEDCLFGGDWESDHRTATGPSDPPSSSANSEAGERERVRVADIIKRLTLANCTQSTDDQEQTYTPKEREQQRERGGSGIRERQQKSFPLIQTSSPRIRDRSCALFDQAAEQQRERGHVLISSPKVRGRQAFNDLLMQMERNRQGELDALVERRPVSRFPQRRRLQSMLRLRCMQRGLTAQHQPSSSSLNRPQGSTITLLRERFNMGSEHDDPSGSGETNLRNRDIENRLQDLRNSSTVKNSVDSHHTSEELENINIPQSPAQHEDEHVHVQPESYAFEEASLSSDVTWQETSFETSNIDTQETSNNGWDASAEEQDVHDQQFLGINYNWFTEISRPRRYWEDRRQAWYQEMLDTDSHGEIRQLLERRRVSTFLSSDFRQRIDELMISRLQRQEEETVHMENQQEEFMSFFRRHESHDQHPAGGGHQQEDDVDEEEEEKGSSGCQYHEVGDYFDQTDSSIHPPLPSSIMSSWSSYQGGDDSGQIESTSNLHQPQPSQSYYHEETRQCSSSTNHPSIEMELIYGLRGHMEQLHHEMAQLRKSIESCMDMQVKLQHSIKQEVHSVQEEGKKSLNMKPRKGSCCICYEMQVNSLLYRCGHMCTCIKCAHELQWSSGKCPICRAPIVDVVRAYADS